MPARKLFLEDLKHLSPQCVIGFTTGVRKAGFVMSDTYIPPGEELMSTHRFSLVAVEAIHRHNGFAGTGGRNGVTWEAIIDCLKYYIEHEGEVYLFLAGEELICWLASKQ